MQPADLRIYLVPRRLPLFATVVVVMTVVVAPPAPARGFDGRAYLEQCTGDDAAEQPRCRDPLLAELFTRDARSHTMHNPLAACPVDLQRVEAFEDFIDKLQAAFVNWLRRQPQALDESVDTLASRALSEIDLCAL
jgi:hypothetical protein